MLPSKSFWFVSSWLFPGSASYKLSFELASRLLILPPGLLSNPVCYTHFKWTFLKHYIPHVTFLLKNVQRFLLSSGSIPHSLAGVSRPSLLLYLSNLTPPCAPWYKNRGSGIYEKRLWLEMHLVCIQCPCSQPCPTCFQKKEDNGHSRRALQLRCPLHMLSYSGAQSGDCPKSHS